MPRMPSSPLRGKNVGGAPKDGDGGTMVDRLRKTLGKGEPVAEQGTNDAAEKLIRGVQDALQRAQDQNTKLVRDFFGDTVQTLKQQVQSDRETLESLAEQVPGGQEEPFRTVIRELSGAYEQIERSLDEANDAVAKVGVSGRTGAASEGSEDTAEEAEQAGNVAVEDAVENTDEEAGDNDEGFTGQAEGTPEEASGRPGETPDGATEQAQNGAKVTAAAKRRAEELGVDLSSIGGTGAGGLITTKDVVGAAD